MTTRENPTLIRRYTPPAAVNNLWVLIEDKPDGTSYRHRYEPALTLIVSEADELDGKRWVHLSVACGHRMPSWGELVAAKELFLGPDTRALMILPPRAEWVNVHKYAMSLWCCLDGDGLPDFRQGQGSS